MKNAGQSFGPATKRKMGRYRGHPSLKWGSLCARPAMARLNRKGIPGDGGDIIPIQSRNECRAHFSGTNRFAFVMISAVSKSELIHFPDHSDDSFVPFRLALRQEPQVGSLGGYKKHSGRVWASCHASAAADTSGCFHGKIRIMLGNWQRVGLGRRTGSSRDITTGFNDVVESAAIHREVLDYRESSRPERLNPDCISTFEPAHVKLAGRLHPARSMRNAVDHKGTHPANPFPAIRVERYWLFVTSDQSFVHDIQHLQKGRSLWNIIGLV